MLVRVSREDEEEEVSHCTYRAAVGQKEGRESDSETSPREVSKAQIERHTSWRASTETHQGTGAREMVRQLKGPCYSRRGS